MTNAGREVEIKVAVADIGQTQRLLDAAGFRVSKPRVFEDNIVYDTPDRTLRGGGRLLRVRRCGTRALLTYKGPAAPGKHKSREELEMELADAGGFETILTRLGYEPSFRYQKYRTEYEQAGEAGIVTLDETPIGNFLEIEGAPDWIDQAAERLGFRESEYILASYAALYMRYREEHPEVDHPEAPSGMTFAGTTPPGHSV
ncbi:MAG: class IV adenylate cyclase [Bryobacteraceae bacterium]